jgi:transposase-like protein
MERIPYSRLEIQRILDEASLLGWDQIKEVSRDFIKYLIDNFLLSELELFLGCEKYERIEDRKSYRNGYYERMIGTTLGEIRIRYPRIRKGMFESKFIRKYKRRQRELDFAVLSCFLLGGSVRKTSRICDAFAEVGISSSTVSTIFKELDQKAREFHSKVIDRKYKFLVLDGLWVNMRERFKRKKVVLFAMGITAEGKKEMLGFIIADGESEYGYTALLNNLLKRGFDPSALELAIHDGAGGIIAALNMCLPYAAKQYCIFHKVQGIAQKLNRRSNRKVIMRDAGDIYRHSRSKQEAIASLRYFILKWSKSEPRAVRYMKARFDDTLTYFDFPKNLWRIISTSNYMERSLREIRRRTNPMGYFKNERSINRIMYALTYLLNSGGIPS